jgi:hypothetical protein
MQNKVNSGLEFLVLAINTVLQDVIKCTLVSKIPVFWREKLPPISRISSLKLCMWNEWGLQNIDN